jgi:putative ABC transport system permease protein
MLRNYLLIALRNLRKQKLYSFITIGGLAVGLAACLLILLFVRDEVSYDKWLPNGERIAKVEVTFTVPGRKPMEFGQSSGLVKGAMEKDFSSDIEKVVRIYEDHATIRAGDKLFNDTIAFVDKEFFDVFDLPVTAGQREEAVRNNSSVLVSETMAQKYFGDASPIGKVISVDKKMDLKVVGVLEDLPRNTHLKLGFVALFDTSRYTKQPWIAERWTSANLHTYVLFRSAAAIDRVARDLKGFADRNVSFKIPGFSDKKPSQLVRFDLMPLLDIHLHARKPGYFKPGGDITTVITFSIIAALILLIACINFINLATARSLQRAREVAMRKVLGASRKQLVGQFLGEALVTATIAMVIAVALVELAIGPYNGMVDKQLSFDLIGDPALLGLMVGLIAVVGLIGGSYPAIYLSRFKPARVLKANQYNASGSSMLRNVLVVFQFAISIGLIVSTAIVYEQTSYARDLDLGYQKANRLVIAGAGASKQASTLKRELQGIPHVKSVSLSSDVPPLASNNNTILYTTSVPTEGKRLIIETLRVDADFFATYGVQPLAGRLFSKDHPADELPAKDKMGPNPTQSIVVNQTFLTKLGVDSPEQAIGRELYDVIGDNPTKNDMIRTKIVGVVPDMYLRSIRFNITPLMFYLRSPERRSFNAATIQVEPGHMKETLAAAQALWAKLVPGVPVRTKFVDSEIAAQYDAVEKRAKIFGSFAMFAVLVACLGLFGLAAFAAERRTKEIGMRKALGASVLDIIRLLLWQFARPVLVANLIAWPVAFYVMQRWLETFEYHIDLTEPVLMITVFLGAGLLALVIAWATVAGQATRVARASPVHALRCE